MPSSCAGFVCYMTTTSLSKSNPEGYSCRWDFSEQHGCNTGTRVFLKVLVLDVSCLQDAEVFQCARAPQLFQTEMCRRETKNRTHTPLSQLPLHRLWDCLCVSPLSSFTVPVSPPPSFPPSLSILPLSQLLNQPYFPWPGLHHHEPPETGHHFPRLPSIRRRGGAGCGNCLHRTSLWVFLWGWTQTLIAKIP